MIPVYVILLASIMFFVLVISLTYGAFSMGNLTTRLQAAPVVRTVQRRTGTPAVGGQARQGMAYRSYEGDIAAVDTLTGLTAFGGTAQTMVVPQGAAEIDMVAIGLSGDIGAAVASVRCHCQVRLVGQGIPGGPHDFGGPALTVQGVTSGNAMTNGNICYENTNIPVVAGAEIQIQGAVIGEDPGDVTVCVTLGYVLA